MEKRTKGYVEKLKKADGETLITFEKAKKGDKATPEFTEKTEKGYKSHLELIEKAKKGDSRAFGELYSNYSNELYRFAFYYLGSRELAQDAVQDAVLAAYRGIASLRDNSAYKAWQFKILSNCCKNYITELSNQRKNIPLEDALGVIPDEISPDLSLSIELSSAISTLKEEERRIVLLAVVGGYKSREIAKILDCPSGTVRSKLSRSLKKLKGILEAEGLETVKAQK